MAKYIPLDAVVAEIERREKAIVDDNGNLGFKDCQKAFNEIDELKKFINTLEVKEMGVDLGDPKGDKSAKYIIDTKNLGVKEVANTHNIRFPHYKSIVEKVFGAGNLESFEYDEAERLVSLAKEELLKDLEVKEVDFWHKQSEEDIDDSIIGWSMHSFICLMKDGTTQEFTGIQDESYEGGISKHLDCVDDNYEWEYDDIIYWIEVPNIKAQKGE